MRKARVCSSSTSAGDEMNLVSFGILAITVPMRAASRSAPDLAAWEEHASDDQQTSTAPTIKATGNICDGDISLYRQKCASNYENGE